jgi:N,N'-diacetylchitobiose phosphorylase
VLGYHGESLFVAFQVRLGLTVYAEIAERLGKPEEARWALAHRKRLDAYIQSVGWDGDWFIWAITEDGTVYGTKITPKARSTSTPRSGPSSAARPRPEQAERCMATVHERLATPYGLMLSAPPFVKSPVQVMRAVVFNPGIKENAGIFNHTQGWGVMAECLLGHGDRAYDYYRAAMPAAWNDRAEIRQCEPYVQGQTTYSTYSPRPGNTRTAWLTGAAAWSYWSATQSHPGPAAGGGRPAHRPVYPQRLARLQGHAPVPWYHRRDRGAQPEPRLPGRQITHPQRRGVAG